MSGEGSASEVTEMEAPIANGGGPPKGGESLTDKKDKESNGVDNLDVDSADKEGAALEKEGGEAKIPKEAKVEESMNATKQEDNHGDKEEKREEETEKSAVEEKSVLEAREDDSNQMNNETEGSKVTEEEVNGLDKESEKVDESEEKAKEDKENDDEEMVEKSNERKDEEHEEKEEDGGAEEMAEDIKEDRADVARPEEHKEDRGSKKGRLRKTAAEKVKDKKELKQEVEQRTPGTDRPVRERKSVERLVATIEKDANKEIHIEKGRGTPLKDIPNVAYKLARRKPDDTFKLLHSVMFGRRVKAFQIRGNISKFSGFVWHDDEEKQRSKVKEKFDKCTKEKLLEVCDILDIPDAKATTRKEDIVVKLIEFLVAPHATTTILLAEKESGKGQKRKRGTKRSSSTPSGSSNRAAKSQRKSGDASKRGSKRASSDSDVSEDEKEEEHETVEEKTVNGITEQSDHEMQDISGSEEESSSEDESDEDVGKKRKQNSSNRKQSTGKAKSNTKASPPPKTTKRSSLPKRSKVDDDSEASPTMRKKNESAAKKFSTLAKSASKEKTGKKVEKGKHKAKDEKVGPSNDELRDAICEILKEVDFNTATFTDILTQLAKKFDTDLTPRKSAIKLVIQEELQKLADEADDEEDADDSAGKDEVAIDGTEVKA